MSADEDLGNIRQLAFGKSLSAAASYYMRYMHKHAEAYFWVEDLMPQHSEHAFALICLCAL